MNKITNNVYLGPYPNPWVRYKLKKAGVTHILNARRKKYELKNVVLFHNPMKDEVPGPQNLSYWQKSIDFARKAVESGGTLYVHCKAGVNRGPGHCYAALRGLGYGQDEAWNLVKDGRKKARPRYVETIEEVLSWR